MNGDRQTTDAIRDLLDVTSKILDGMQNMGEVVARLESRVHGTRIGIIVLLEHLAAQNVIDAAAFDRISSEMRKAESDGAH